MNFEILTCFLYKWQTLVGAVIGVFFGVLTPTMLFFLGHYWNKRDKRRRRLINYAYIMARSINELTSAETEIKLYIARLRKLLSDIQNAPEKEWSLIQVNFPSCKFTLVFDNDVYFSNSKNLYLANKIAFALTSMKSLNDNFDTASELHQKMIDLNERLVFSQVPVAQVKNYSVHSLQNMIVFCERYLLENNIPILLKVLVTLHVVIEDYFKKSSFSKVRLLNRKSFRFFGTRENYDNFLDQLFDAVEDSYKSKVEKDLQKINKEQEKIYQEQINFQNQ